METLPEFATQTERSGSPPGAGFKTGGECHFLCLVTGCQWSNLPKDYPNPHGVYYHYRKWSRDGTWQRINRAMVYLERRSLGQFARPSAALIDSPSIKVSDQG